MASSSTYEQCRLCKGKSDHVNIFDNNFENVKLDQKIFCTLNIQVHRTDQLLTVCKICKAKVDEFFDFKTICTSAESPRKFIKEEVATIKIKKEKVDEEDDKSPAKPIPMPFGALPNGARMMYPTFIIDAAGNYVPTAMVPVGNPIPYSSLSAGMTGLSALGPFAQSSGNGNAAEGLKPIQIKKGKPDDEGSGSQKSPVANDELNHKVPESDDNVNSEVPEKEDSESSEDLKSVDDLINEVHTDKEDESSKSSAADDKCEDLDSSKKEKTRKTRSKGSKDAKEINNEEEQSSNDSSGRLTPFTSRARRGHKRRGSSVPSTDTTKRRRSGRREITPSVSDAQDEPTSAKRFTRSSTGSRPRRRIIDGEESDDGDFDVDDPDDPEYTTSKPKESSSDDSDTESDEKKKTEKVQKEKLIMQHFNANRVEKEEDAKKSCPHCKITYKRWLSYDDHIKTCEAEKKLGKEKSVKESPKVAEKADVEDTKEMKCIICLEKFIGTKALREHMVVHQAKKAPVYECKTCHETFNDKGALICHNALKHRCNVTEPIMKSERKKLHCVDCDEHFTSSGDYICHQVLHHRKK